MKNLKLTIELIPKGAWGNNLRQCLSKKDWDILRNFAYKRAGYKCSICGKEDSQLDAHEVWVFDISSKTQTLEDIIALCSSCHGVKHIRNSQRIGYGKNSKSHFLKINECNEMTFANHLFEAETLFNQRNKIYRWKLKTDNLSKLGGRDMVVEQKYIPMIINPYENIDLEKRNIIKSEFRYNPSIQSNIPCPKVLSIIVDNYQGIITVISKYTNKIDWFSVPNKNKEKSHIVKTLYNNVGKFITIFNIKNVESPFLYFRLSGDGGQTFSQLFSLAKA